MATHGKKYRAAFEKVDRAKRYSFQEAVQLALATHYTKNDQGLDIAVRLGVDPRHADQMVRGTVVLPHGVGKSVRVLVFAKGEKEKKRSKPERISQARMNTSTRSRRAGWILTRPLPPPT